MKNFTHLHNHSHFSLLNALPKIPNLIKKAKEFNLKSLALTDDGNLYSAISFYKECKKNEIKPIVGVDFYVALRKRRDKQPKIDNKRYRLVLLAKNEDGYKNLLKLVSYSFLEGYYYKPRIDKELLEKFGKDLVCIIPQFSGPTSTHLRLNNEEKALEEINFYKKTFGEDLYLEIIHQPEIEGQKELQEKIINFSKKNNLKLVATGDTYYLEKKDREARNVLVDVGNIKMGKMEHNDGEDFSFHSPEKMEDFFSHAPESLSNISEIVEKCNLELNLGKWVFPDYDLKNSKNNYDEELKKISYEIYESGKVEKSEFSKKRLDYELSVIAQKGYSVYFLIITDFIDHSKKNGILTNTRGSAAGSLVSYLCGITTVDPLRFKLPFERFLNPERPSPPDIDLDIAEDKRDELISYAVEKYGKKSVAQIGTFGTMAARGAVKDCARALGYEYKIGDKISKLIPIGKQGFPMFIDRALDEVDDLKDLYKKDLDVKKIIDMAKKIEGSARHISIHAAGVVISPTEVSDYTPVQVDQKTGKIVTQYDMHAVEDAGLIKFDFLGLKNLTIITEALKRVDKVKGKKINIYEIPEDDKKTFKMLTEGKTGGVFQLSSEGMTKWLKELKPSSVDDINAMVALYRPGPMEFIPEYILRKNNPEKVTYPDPRTEPYLKASYGLLIYQDDIMQLAVDMAGYSWLEADKFRKAMGKKIPELMAEQEEKFKAGCLKSKMPEKVVNELWENIVTFAAYGFNKGHAAAYGWLSYRTAYLKANFPTEYMAAVLTADAGNNESIKKEIEECKKMDIEVLAPDINESYEDFAVAQKNNEKDEKKEVIRFGLLSIKNFGEKIAEEIVNERKKNGNYLSLEDFLKRTSPLGINKKSLEALSLSGALDGFSDRSEILANIEELLEFSKNSREENSDQGSLFSEEAEKSQIKLKNSEGVNIILKTGKNEDKKYTLPFSNREKLFWEKELLGLYISGHPLDRWKEKISAENKNIASILEKGRETKYVIAGIIENLKIITTKKGKEMAFVNFSDFTGSLEGVIFPDTYKEFSDILEIERTFAFSGKLEKKDDEEFSFIVEKLKKID